MNAEAPAPEANPGLSPVKSVKSGGRRSYALLTLAFLLIGGYFLREQILFGLGQVLTSAEAPRKADLIVVLGGDVRGNRILQAAQLVRDGYAPRVLVSGMANLYGSSESDRAIEFAVRHGASAEVFIPLRDDVTSTVEEAASDLVAMRRMGIHSFLLVTSAYHTRRAGKIFHRIAPDLELRTIAAPDPYWNDGHWWTSREGCKLWLYEAMKSVADIFRI
jgi:uncharacterized SAM-binding protein YcdF (DUF218 family)